MSDLSLSVLDLLAQELATALELEALLERERADLGRASAEAIEATAEAKITLARRAAELARSRDSALARAGLPAGRKGLTIACERGGEPGRRRLEEILACAQRIRHLNERNGALVDLRLQHTAAALAVLLRGGPQAAQVYSRDGLARAENVSRTRATA